MSITEITESADALLTERVCRVTLDLKVRTTEVTSAILQRTIIWDETDQAGSFSVAERQNRLLHALIENQQALHQFLTYVATSDLQSRLDAHLIISETVQDEDAILNSLLSRLSPEEVDYICDGAGDRTFGEEIELLHQCFSVAWSESVPAHVAIISSDALNVLERE